MSPIPSRLQRQNLLKSTHIPAPLGGINRVDPESAMPAGDCLVALNMFGSKYGYKVRKGYRDWVTDIGDPAEEVRSLLSFKGSASDGSADRLFACTTSGIWDVSSSTDTPSQVYAFPTQNAVSGYGIYTGFTTTAGHFLVYMDEANGYILYTESTDTWTIVAAGSSPGEIDGADPRDFAFVVAWKTRLLFVEKDSARMWYLPVGQITGTVGSFEFGNKFRYGGDLVGLWSLTMDGGEGVDDYLIAVGRGGDVVVYAGTDPSSASAFEQVGKWFVGGVPAGRRIATDFGGDVLLMSSLGVMPLSKLRGGGEIANPDSYATRKIAPIFSDTISQRGHLTGWEIRVHPQESALIVNTPAWTGQSDEQFVMSLSSSGKGWSIFNGLPMVCSEVWGGRFYFGTEDGRVCLSEGVYDGVALDGGLDDATDIQFAFLSAYSGLGTVSKKQVRMVRPMLRVDGAVPAYTACARYDFDESAISETVYSTGGGVSLWDTAVWDTSLWAEGLASQKSVIGSVGIGSHVAIALKGECHAETILIGFDVAWEEGGLI